MKNNYFVALDSEHIYGFKDYQQDVQLGARLTEALLMLIIKKFGKLIPLY